MRAFWIVLGVLAVVGAAIGGVLFYKRKKEGSPQGPGAAKAPASDPTKPATKSNGGGGTGVANVVGGVLTKSNVSALVNVFANARATISDSLSKTATQPAYVTNVPTSSSSDWSGG